MTERRNLYLDAIACYSLPLYDILLHSPPSINNLYSSSFIPPNLLLQGSEVAKKLFVSDVFRLDADLQVLRIRFSFQFVRHPIVSQRVANFITSRQLLLQPFFAQQCFIALRSSLDPHQPPSLRAFCRSILLPPSSSPSRGQLPLNSIRFFKKLRNSSSSSSSSLSPLQPSQWLVWSGIGRPMRKSLPEPFYAYEFLTNIFLLSVPYAPPQPRRISHMLCSPARPSYWSGITFIILISLSLRRFLMWISSISSNKFYSVHLLLLIVITLFRSMSSLSLNSSQSHYWQYGKRIGARFLTEPRSSLTPFNTALLALLLAWMPS